MALVESLTTPEIVAESHCARADTAQRSIRKAETGVRQFIGSSTHRGTKDRGSCGTLSTYMSPGAALITVEGTQKQDRSTWPRRSSAGLKSSSAGLKNKTRP